MCIHTYLCVHGVRVLEVINNVMIIINSVSSSANN